MVELLKKIKEILNIELINTEHITFTIGVLIALILSFFATSIILKLARKIITRNLPPEDKNKFVSLFQFFQYLAYIIVIMFTLNASGVNISVLLTASAALFIGLGFALQQLFQDLISGVLIIVDQSLHVGDVIEINGKVCKVEKISLRSTKAVTRNERVMIIPNHFFLTEILFNWTQNSNVVREEIRVGVAYGSDVAKVKEILLTVADVNPFALQSPEPVVFFDNFGDSSLDFVLYFFVADVFKVQSLKSDLRTEIDKKFRENNVTIPFPQRDVHFYPTS